MMLSIAGLICCVVGVAIAFLATYWAVGVRRVAITETPIARRALQGGGALIAFGFVLASIPYVRDNLLAPLSRPHVETQASGWRGLFEAAAENPQGAVLFGVTMFVLAMLIAAGIADGFRHMLGIAGERNDRKRKP